MVMKNSDFNAVLITMQGKRLKYDEKVMYLRQSRRLEICEPLKAAKYFLATQRGDDLYFSQTGFPFSRE
jgi:hypothetical protein